MENLENIENIPIPNLIVDKLTDTFIVGQYSGGYITKLTGNSDALVFSDNLDITETEIKISGLHVGFKNGKAYSHEETSVINDFGYIDYIIKLDSETISEFDAARFSASYPNIIRFLKTSCVFLDTDYRQINHLDFVAGEILNRPVAVTHNNGIIIGDRLVVDENKHLIFYDAILIGRDFNKKIQMTYEHFIMIPLSSLRYIVLLGAENF
jgi:hypothetical protein